MKLATTTGDITQYGLSHADAIRILCRAGFRHIDVSFYDLDRQPSPFSEEGWESYTDGLLALADREGADFVQCHTPGCTNPFYKGKRATALYEATVRSLRVSARLGIRCAVIHAGWAEGLSEDESFARNRAFLAQFIPVLEETGITLCVENSTRVNMGEQYRFYTGETLSRFLDEMNHPLIAAAWDVGHAHLEGHNYPDLIALGDRLAAVHIHDNGGGADDHILPFTGTIPMDEVLCGLMDNGFPTRGGVFTLETDCLLPARPAYPPELRIPTPTDRPPRPAQPTEGMLLAAELMRYATGRYILEAYGLFDD